jgi:hypothetical protein
MILKKNDWGPFDLKKTFKPKWGKLKGLKCFVNQNTNICFLNTIFNHKGQNKAKTIRKMVHCQTTVVFQHFWYVLKVFFKYDHMSIFLPTTAKYGAFVHLSKIDQAIVFCKTQPFRLPSLHC